MKKIIVLLSLAFGFVFNVNGQIVEGHVYDDKTREPLIGVTVTYSHRGELKGSVTDVNGYYTVTVPDGGASLVFSYVGYEDVNAPVVVDARETVKRDVYMKVKVNLLENVVVSAGRAEQKQSEITVSMDILKKADIARQVPTDLGTTLNTLPGVDINDGQPSIRGGNGWTYGVGSRSLVLVDGMSVLGSQGGEINWNMIPMETVEQIEVIKGASSVLYGSSALNGLINIRTTRPGLVPKTHVKFYSGFYGDPDNKDYVWWNKTLWKEGKYAVKPVLRSTLFSGSRNPMFEGFDMSHTRRIGDFDVSVGLNFLTDEGYREQAYRKRFRIGGNVTYHQPNTGDNIVNYGVNYNFLTEKSGDFLLWRSVKDAYSPSPVTNMGREGNTFSIDPFYNFTNRNRNSSHKIKGRFMYEDNSLLQVSTPKTFLEIMGNMGPDINAIRDLANGNLGPVWPVVPPIAQGDLNGIIDGAYGVLNTIFPKATTADYMDLIAWLMNNGVPSGSEDLFPWLSNAVHPKEPQAYVDKDYTYFLDYQYQKKVGGAQLTAGTTYTHVKTTSSLTGTHNSDNVSLFFQYDQRFFNRLSVSLGVRGEYYRVDGHKKEAKTKVFGSEWPFKPILRGGLNYQLAEYSFLRASVGQGYRYPSMTEKFARKDIGGVGVYPNHDLRAETGVNAELGFVQGYKIGNFEGFLDIAGFYTRYKNMIEFNIGFFNNSTFEHINSVNQLLNMFSQGEMPGLGAQFYNIGKAQIYGLDVSTNGTYRISPGMKFLYNVGYVYIQPEDPDYKKKNEIENTYTDPLQFKEKSNPSKYLKYRQKHTVKGTIDFEWHRISLGTNLMWKSKTLAVDYVFMDERPRNNGQYRVMDYVRGLLFGAMDGETLETYWEKKNKSYFLMDLRAGIKATDKLHFNFMVTNLMNKEYSTRPMAVAPPRTYVMSVDYNF